MRKSFNICSKMKNEFTMPLWRDYISVKRNQGWKPSGRDAIDQSDITMNLRVDDGLLLVRGGSDLDQVIDARYGRQSKNSVRRNACQLAILPKVRSMFMGWIRSISFLYFTFLSQDLESKTDARGF
jgi:hypothetical protein